MTTPQIAALALIGAFLAVQVVIVARAGAKRITTQHALALWVASGSITAGAAAALLT